MKKIIYSIILSGCTIWSANAQEEGFGPINTGAANFLTITPDARSAAIGGVGVALPANNNAIFYNGATVLSNPSVNGGSSYTYTPWMRDYQSGYALHSAAGFYKIDQKNAILAGFRYYNYPKIKTAEWGVTNSKDIHPNEWAIDLGYTREIITNFSLSAILRYIHSDMGNIGNAESASAVAFDLGAFYQREIGWVKGASWSAGAQLSNIGSKISYQDTKESIPAMVKAGGAINLPLLSIHRFIVAADLGYRLTPSDVKSLNVSAGVEYSIYDRFMLRGGYHYGDKEKGDLSYGTAGAGISCYGINLDFSWLFADSDNPLKNTFRLSVGYTF